MNAEQALARSFYNFWGARCMKMYVKHHKCDPEDHYQLQRSGIVQFALLLIEIRRKNNLLDQEGMRQTL